jgi:hypothetical protein
VYLPPSALSDSNAPDVQAKTLTATVRVLEPLLRLLIEKGVSYQMLDEAIKAALVRISIDNHPDGEEATGSQLSLYTGLNRKEIKRLREEATARNEPESPLTVAAEVYFKWRSLKPWVDAHGRPRILARSSEGAAQGMQSFEELVKSITVDHRPRAVLDELLRLKMVSINEHEVAIATHDFMTTQSYVDALVPFVDNLRDHAAASVHNVLDGTPKMLERSIHAHGFSSASVSALQAAALTHWQTTHDHLAHLGGALEAGDKASGSPTNERLRIGMYMFREQLAEALDTPINETVKEATKPTKQAGARKKRSNAKALE